MNIIKIQNLELELKLVLFNSLPPTEQAAVPPSYWSSDSSFSSLPLCASALEGASATSMLPSAARARRRESLLKEA